MTLRLKLALGGLLLGSLAACEPDKDSEGIDADGDLATTGVDCDDSDPEIHPWAEESCDGIDNDCDGVVDEYAQVIGTDGCDGVDNDCDGVIDEDGIQRWYLDADGDGDFDMDTTVEACEAPEGYTGYTSGQEDCDDSDPLANTRTFELCGDGEDDDCDGVVDEEASCMDTIIRGHLSEDSEGGSIGAAFVGPADLNGDGREDLIAFGGLKSTDLPWVYVWYAEPAPGDQLTDSSDAALTYVDGVDLVRSYKNLAVVRGAEGMPAALAQGFPSTRVDASNQPGIVILAPFPIEGTQEWEDEAVATWIGENHYDAFGCSVDDAGDINGDGIHDLLIGAIGVDAGEEQDVGAAYLVYGPLTGTWSAGDIDTVLLGQDEWDLMGWDVRGIGDIDGDGLDDIAVSAVQLESDTVSLGVSLSDVDSGYVTIFQDAPSGAFSPADADATLYIPDFRTAQLGHDIEAGDLDGDGYLDLVISAPLANLVSVVPSPVSGLHDIHTVSQATLTADFGTVRALGEELDIARDSDGDGSPEILLVLDGDRPEPDLALVVSGPFEGTLTLPDDAARIIGPTSDSDVFVSIGNLGDLDGDGLDEIGVGMPTSFEDPDEVYHGLGQFGILGPWP